MYAFRVKAYSHHFAVSRLTEKSHRVVREYAKNFVEMDINRRWDGSITATPKDIFAARSADKKEYRFHINDLDNFFTACDFNGIPRSSIEFIVEPMYTPPVIPYKIKAGVAPYDYQLPIIEHLASPLKSKLVELQTGQGKTLSTLLALVKMQVRAVIAIKGMYVSRWMDDLAGDKRKLDLVKEDILVVRGSKPLRRLIALALNGLLEAKIIIITNKTLRDFYKHYRETNGDTSFYGCAPYKLYEILGVGVRVIDEVHEDFHCNFMQDLYSHIPTTINLSATFRSDDQFKNNIYRIMFPPETRAKIPDLKKYTAVYGLTYTFHDRTKVKYIQRGRGSYSHVVLEESIMRSPKMLANYLKLVESTLDTFYLTEYRDGARALVFASTVEMCKLIRDHLRQSFYFNDFTINKYTGEDEYESLVTADIAISTLGSAGTAVDIQNLITVISTVAVSKSETSIQNLGRIRENKSYPGITPKFIYFISMDIPKHIEYHQKKLNTYKGRVLLHSTLDSQMKV